MPKARVVFPKVAAARERLADKAIDILNQYIETVAAAQAAGEFEVATKSLQWLMEHMPTDPDGGSMVDTSIDKNKTESLGPSGPTIQIGIALGGVKQAKALPPVEVIDVTDESDDTES